MKLRSYKKQNFLKKIKEIKLVKEPQSVEISDELGGFFTAITKEKVDLTEKIKKEEVKIAGLEELFDELSTVKKKKTVEKKKVLLLEPEEVTSEWDKKQQEVDEELEKVAKDIEEREELAKTIESESINEYKVEDNMIDKVKKQIASMKNANLLDKERINQLSSLDTWEKLKEEFLNFKHTVNVQLGTVGGGGLDPHNIYSDFLPAKTNTYNLGSADRTWKDLHLSGSSLVIGGTTMDSGELTVLDSVTAGTVAASKAVIVDSNKDIGTFRNLTIDGVFTDGNYTFDTSGNVSGLGTVSSGAITSSGVVTAAGFTIGSAVISEAELEILDGANVTTTELNLIDGGTSRGTDALASGDGILINDAGTMKMTNVDTVKTFMQAGLSSEGTGILSTGETGGTKFLREDGDGTSSWQSASDTTKLPLAGGTMTGDLNLGDSVDANFGASADLKVYHDGTNSYITNAVGALKIATETSGIALTIGHSTSEVTVADNLTVAGNLTVSGTETIVDTVTMNAQNAVVFEGATADNYETTLTIVDPTADRTVYMPNATGYLPVLAAASTTTITSTPEELNVVDGVTAGTVAASKAVVVDSNKDIAGFRNMTISGNFLPSATNTYNLGSASKRFNDLFLAGDTIDLAGSTISADGTGTISISADGVTLPTGSKVGNNELAVFGSSATGSSSQVIRRVDFFSASGGLSTANATFEFNAEVADRYSFTDASTFTLSDGSSLTDSGITLFQF